MALEQVGASTSVERDGGHLVESLFGVLSDACPATLRRELGGRLPSRALEFQDDAKKASLLREKGHGQCGFGQE